jgi:large repetitive protein
MKSMIGVVALLWAAMAARGGTSPLTASPATLAFSYQSGNATLPPAQTLQVTSSPTGASFTIAISGSPFDAAWLMVSTPSGKAPASVKVQVNPTGLPAGVYTGALTVSATVNSVAVTQTTAVTLTVTAAPPTVTATPSSLSFSYTTGDPIPSASLGSALLLSSNGSALTATVSVKGATWLTVTPTGNITLLGLLKTLTVTVDPTGLASKVYTGQITVNAPGAANSTLTVNVTLTVNAAPPKISDTWPAGVMQSAKATTVTLLGSGFTGSTISASGFTPASTITVSDGTSTATETFYIPVYQASATTLRLGVASPLPGGALVTAYLQPLSALGGTGPYTYTLASGTLPTGLTLSTGGVISGTPLTAGSYSFTVLITDSSSTALQAYGQLKLTIDPIGATALRVSVAAAPLGLGTVGSAYGPVTLTALGGTGGPYSWSAAGLPAGLAVSSAGDLSGTPTTDGALGNVPATVVGDTAVLAVVPAGDLATAGVLRLAATTPSPGGGTSNEGQFQVYGPEPQILAITNSASLSQGTLSPGELITLWGLGLGPQTLAIYDPSAPPLPTSLPSTGSVTSVTINGTLAPLLYSSATQVGVIVPYTVSGTSAQVILTYGTLSSQPYTAAVASVDPGVYSLTGSGQGQGAILNYNSTTGDYTVNSVSNAAVRGSIVVLYVTGSGATTSTDYDNLIPPSPDVTPLLAPTVTIGGQGAVVLGAQAPPGSVPGLLQINVTVPTTIPASSAAPVVVTIGGVASQSGLTMAVK